MKKERKMQRKKRNWRQKSRETGDAEAKKSAKKKRAKSPGSVKSGRKSSWTKRKRSRKESSEYWQRENITAQQSIPYRKWERRNGISCGGWVLFKTIRFYDINYQLAQNEDKNAIFENWCDFLNYFDSTIHFQLSFINQHSNMAEYEKVIRINQQEDEFDDLRMEFAQMLNNQLAKGNNGLMRTKYITFGIEAENIREARPKLERIESDIMNNFKILGVTAYPLNGTERLQIMYETFNQDSKVRFHFLMMMYFGQVLAQRIISHQPASCLRMEKTFRWVER